MNILSKTETNADGTFNDNAQSILTDYIKRAHKNMKKQSDTLAANLIPVGQTVEEMKRQKMVMWELSREKKKQKVMNRRKPRIGVIRKMAAIKEEIRQKEKEDKEQLLIGNTPKEEDNKELAPAPKEEDNKELAPAPKEDVTSPTPTPTLSQVEDKKDEEVLKKRRHKKNSRRIVSKKDKSNNTALSVRNILGSLLNPKIGMTVNL